MRKGESFPWGELLGYLSRKLVDMARIQQYRLPRDLCCVLDELLKIMERGPEDKGTILQRVATSAQECKACGLHKFRNKVVVGEGNPDAEVVFVGEAPGEEEDLQGRPFVGAAGKLLDRIIEAMGFRREDVFIANVLKCRPPANRTPKPQEVEACQHFLMEQLRAISPKIIVSLGSVATNALLGSQQSITRIRGQMTQWEGVAVMPTYHPSYLLRSPEKKKEVWEDMKKVLTFLGRPVPKRGQGSNPSEES